MHERFGTATVRADDGGVRRRVGADRDLRRARARCPTCGRAPASRRTSRGGTSPSTRSRLRLADGALTSSGRAREADLAAGVLRVLHERSFEDDPTRLLRLARYARAARVRARSPEHRRAGRRRRPCRHGQRRAAGLGAAAAAARAAAGGAAGARTPRAGRGRSCTRRSRSIRRLVAAALDLCPPDARADLAALAACLVGRAPALARGARPRSSSPPASAGTVVDGRRAARPSCDALGARRSTTPRCGGCCAASGPRRSRWRARSAPPRPRAALARRRPPPAARHHRRRPRRRRPERPGGRRRARRRHRRDARRPRARTRRAARRRRCVGLVGSVGMDRPRSRAVPLGGRARRRRAARRAACCSRPATAACRRRRSTRSTSGG